LGKRGRVAAGTLVLDAARSLGVYVESVCGGRGICGKCRVSVAEGHFAKFGIESSAGHLSAPGFIEARYDEKRGLGQGLRLSCAAQVTGDIVIDVPDAFRIAGQTIRKDASTVGMLRDPAVRLFYVEVPEPDMHAPLGEADRLCRAVEQTFALKNVSLSFAALLQLQAVLAASNRELTCAARMDTPSPEIVALFPGYHEELTGLAVDIGSTTIAAHLVDLMTGEILASRGLANPQLRFGEDLMSRVSYAMMNQNGGAALTGAVREAVNGLVGEMLEATGRERASLLDAVFVANPVMHHFFLGLDATPLGQAPFALAQSAAAHLRAEEIGLDFGPGARVYLLPLIAGHVGADAAAVLLAQSPQSAPHPTLVVDVGTNAEIMLWDGKALYAASSPTGPAFEGAEISAGQRAAPGAIERVRIDRQTLAARYRVIGSELWSDEHGFVEAVATTGVTGICGSGIIEVIGEMLLAGVLSPDGIIRGPQNDAEKARLVANGRTWSYVLAEGEPRLLVTQNDVRAIQLAKAALYAGVKLLMDKSGLERISEIRLAGAFGSYIDPAYAMLIGLVPDCELPKVSAVGNAAGQGALMALLDKSRRAEIEETVRRVTKVETALEPRFQEHFVAAMGLPNSVDPFPLTRTHFGLTPLQPRDTTPRRRRR
jgi:uncharacterized 2Fe-2S/4Fe-4S cluster protein (DUF4445 family)